MRCVCGGRAADAEAVEVEPMAGHVLLGLEHDDVDLRGKHAAQNHKAAQTDRDAHGCGLDLPKKSRTGSEVYRSVYKYNLYINNLSHDPNILFYSLTYSICTPVRGGQRHSELIHSWILPHKISTLKV